MAVPSQRQLEKEKLMVQKAHAIVIEQYGVDPCNMDLSGYYIIPPDAPHSTCEICGARVPFLFLGRHIREHRGRYVCSHRACYYLNNRFKTFRGLAQHRRIAHSNSYYQTLQSDYLDHEDRPRFPGREF